MLSLPPPDPPQAAIIVTGTALPPPPIERVVSVDRFDQRRIEQSPTRSLDQLLKEAPGVQLFRRSDSRSAHPTSQGVTLRALGGNAASRLLLTLDGVPQSDPFGGWINWPAYNLASLREVRIVRGGGSVGEGLGALAGVIELTSHSQRGFSGEAAAGSRQSLEGRGQVGLGVGPGLLTAAMEIARSDGFIPITEGTRGPADGSASFRSWNGRARWIAPIADDTELQLSASSFRDWRTRGAAFTANRTKGVDLAARLVGRGKLQWTLLGYWQSRDLESSFVSLNRSRSLASQILLQDPVLARGLGGRAELRIPVRPGIQIRLGADGRHVSANVAEHFSFLDGNATRLRKIKGAAMTAGMFIEGTMTARRLTLSAGGRLDRWSINNGSLGETNNANGALLREENFPERSGWLPTARIGARIELAQGVQLRSAAYLGARLPTLNELFRPFRAGADATAANPLLDPERLAGFEAGIDQSGAEWGLSLTAFVNRLEGSIANVTLGHGPGVFPGVGFVAAGGAYRQRQNVGAVLVRGAELAADWHSGPWSARAGISLTSARVSASNPAAALDGLRPAQTPSLLATLGLGWEKGRRSIQLVVKRVGEQFEDDFNSQLLRGATTLDASFAWPLTSGLQLVARGENITNSLVVAGVGSDGSVERAAPRTVSVGLRVRR